MAVIGSTWTSTTWVAAGGWAANTWGFSLPVVDVAATNCLIGQLVLTRHLIGSLPHARECEGDAVAISAINQPLKEPKYEKPHWEVKIPYTWLPATGLAGFSPPRLDIARRHSDPPLVSVTGTIDEDGDPGTSTDAVLLFDWDTLDPGFTDLLVAENANGYSDDYRYAVWIADAGGKEHLVARGPLSDLLTTHA
jgi:hypothetical protein